MNRAKVRRTPIIVVNDLFARCQDCLMWVRLDHGFNGIREVPLNDSLETDKWICDRCNREELENLNNRDDEGD